MKPAEVTTRDPASPATPPPLHHRREPWAALGYFALYLGYSFWRPESEILHWISLVLAPVLLVLAFQPRDSRSLRQALASCGLQRGRLRRGLGLAAALAAAVLLLQLTASRAATPAWELIRSGRALFLFPIAFGFAALTAGFTEEFFFRGFLQTRLAALLRSPLLGLAAATAVFVLYHLPYAYLNPHWPSAGDWGAAWQAAAGEGILGGVILGGLFVAARGNLLACVLVHATVDAVPLMTMIRFSSG